MSAVDATGAPASQWTRRPPRRPRGLASRTSHPLGTSTWLPDGGRSAQRTYKRPVYVSFVTKATLWDRGLCHYAAHVHPHSPSSLCPRFLSHTKACPADVRPPCFLSSTLRPQPPSQGKIRETHVLVAPKTQTLEGSFRFDPARRNRRSDAGRRPAAAAAAVVAPRAPLPAAPPPSAARPSPPQPQRAPSSLPPSPSSPSSAELRHKDGAPRPAAASSQLDWDVGPAESERSGTPASTLSRGSLSDLSRPPSSLFSRSTDLSSGRSSVSSADVRDSGGSVCASPLPPSPDMEPPLSPPPAGSNRHQSTTPFMPGLGQNEQLSPRPTSSVRSRSHRPEDSSQDVQTVENLHAAPDASPDSDRGLVALTFPSATWSSCPSPKSSPPCSASGEKPTPSPPASRLESRRWPVLPPISPVRGRCGSAASPSIFSELGCSLSHAFDELEAVAPPSTSCLSPDAASDCSGASSPDTDLTPGLAALTVGCDSGNLGSLSRVQLLLLDRPEPAESLQSAGTSEEDWRELSWSWAGALRPLAADGVSERCDSAGKVREGESGPSVGGSWSPSSWIIDPTPSYSMFRASCSPCSSDHGSLTDEESACAEWGDRLGSAAGGSESEQDARRTKVMHILSTLQDETPRRSISAGGRSNFKDFDFLAKYCIFSQEKLAEYKEAFDAEDGDGDGYISCLQVLLALKSMIPPELLTDEEEIYVYRILEMVDFRVTDGLVDLRLFAVIASLAQKIATMDDFMRSLISNMNFRSLEVRLFKAKQLFLFLLEEQRGEPGAQRGFISAEQLLLELKAGGIHLEQEAAIRLELQHVPPLDLLDFLAYLPLFMLIHKSVIANPLNDSGDL